MCSVQSHESQYAEMAVAAGIDPASKQGVHFNHANRTFMQLLETHVEAPLRAKGVDFFWPDWQMGRAGQGIDTPYPLPNVNAPFLLSHWRTSYAARHNLSRRDVVLTRWGGLGSHRYQYGHTGDAKHDSWDSVARHGLAQKE